MDIANLRILALRAADGEDNFKKGAVGFSGYGFVFQDCAHSNEPYIITSRSSKVCGVGAYRGNLTLEQIDKIKHLDEIVHYDEKYDCLFGGSLKTLLPKLKFGGDETLFLVWMYLITPSGKQFPATFYFGASGTALGGWRFEDYDKIFPKNFTRIINSSPFDFNKGELDALIEALEFALKKVPITDFYGVYHHDFGNALMGVKARIPFIIELGFDYDKIDIEFYLEEVEIYREKFDDIYNK